MGELENETPDFELVTSDGVIPFIRENLDGITTNLPDPNAKVVQNHPMIEDWDAGGTQKP